MKILIATATAGGGHLQAAAALEEAWKRFRPRDTVRRLDILDFTPRLYRKAYAEGYVRLAEKAPELYAHAFRKSDNPAFVRKITKLRRMSARWLTRRFIHALNEFRPDALVCPHFLPIETMGSLDEKGLKVPRPLTVCVITDFEAHALWMEPCVDIYCVAMEDTRARLVARGIPRDKVIVTGIPVSQRFLKPAPRAAALKAVGLKAGVPNLLILGGGLGMGPLVETMTELDKSRRDFQMMVVTGRNEALRKTLAARAFAHRVKVFGFVSNMETLMSASDLIVTKPGGLTTSEALALGKPLLIVNPLPGQEEANSDFLLQRGAGVKANRLEDLAYRIDELLRPGRLAPLRKAAKRLGRPQAALRICQNVAKRLLIAAALLLPAALQAYASCGLKKDEEVVFFPSLAVWDAADKSWKVRVRGWVYEPETDSAKRRALLALLRKSLGIPENGPEAPLFKSRAQSFLVDNKERRLEIELAGKRHRLPISDESGHVDAEVTVPQMPRGSWTSYRTVPCLRDNRVFWGKALAAEDRGLVIVSDIDDTIKQSHILEPQKMLAGAFLHEYEAVPGMAELYRRWNGREKDAFFCYVSASPWQLYAALDLFLKRHSFPEGVFYLKRFRWKDRSFLSLFGSPEEYKGPLLRDLLRQFPHRKFIFVGDSSEKDPEIYASLAREYGSQVEHIYIRVHGLVEENRLERAFQGLPPNLWRGFRKPEELS